MATSSPKPIGCINTGFKMDLESYNKPSKLRFLGELAFVPVLLHMLIMFFIFARNLFDPINIVYTSSLVITAVIIDAFRSSIAERKYIILKGIVNFCCFIPISFYCVIKFYVAAVQFGHSQNNVIPESCAFIFSNIFFYCLMYVYIKKDFKYLQSEGKMVTLDPEMLTLSEKKTLSVYNILFFSSVYTIFVVQSLCIILAEPIRDSGFLQAIMKPERTECGKEGYAFLSFMVFVLGILLAELICVLTIIQSLYVLSWKNPKNENDVSFTAIA